MKEILIAPNAFKECADQIEIASLIKNNFPEDEYRSITCPLSDGGDGFLNVCVERFDLARMRYKILSPDNSNEMDCEIAVNKTGTTAYIEVARVVGLKVIPDKMRNPILLNSKGLGELLNHIILEYKSLKKVIIGIGGTGTNDLGLGIASVFGMKLFIDSLKEIDVIPANYHLVKEIIWEQREYPFEVELIVDVDTPLLGAEGSTKVFAKQKGASDSDIEIMETGFNNIYNLLIQKNLMDSAKKLNGAGGGLAAGFQIFFNAKIKYASDFILNDLSLEKLGKKSDMIITGEGVFDSQSLMSKASGVLIDHFENSGAQVFVICGKAEKNIQTKIPGNVKIIEMSKYFNSAEESIKNYKKGIQLACNEIKQIICKN